ncbi:MAG: four helix bundle protein [Chloroflexi bacterium]|nr:four helix bundle protein [Chloroflexota bacterium]
MADKIRTHRELKVYQKSFDAAMTIFERSRSFPKEETYSLTDQIRRSSRSTAANIAEAWRRRRFEAYFISKLSDAESEAAETQVWLEFAVKCAYLPSETGKLLYRDYNAIISTLVGMINHPETWVLQSDGSPAKTPPAIKK